MKVLKIVLASFAFVMFVNIPLVSMIVDSIFRLNYYNYSTSDGYWTQHLISVPDTNGYPDDKFLYTKRVDTVIGNLHYVEERELGRKLRQQYPGADTIIYRTFKPNYLLFWRWGQYIIGLPQYDFPYKSWDEIKKNRPPNFVLNGRWQMF